MNPFFHPIVIKTAIILSLILPATVSAISFQEVTAKSGISYVGQSWGSSWGDFNGDGWPDLWTSNHSQLPSLYINNQDGTFTDIASAELLPDGIWDLLSSYAAHGYDTHGAAWADFDNDGDQDLVQLADGGNRKQANHLYINAGNGKFERTEQAANLGINQPVANARTPVWFDWNNDGLLDLLVVNAMRNVNINPPTTLFEQQTSSGFINVQSTELNLQEPTSFAMLSDLTGDGRKEILIGATSTSVRVYSNTGYALTDETINLGLDSYKHSLDTSLSDLTGNLQTEIHIVRGEVDNGLEQEGDYMIESHLTASKDQKGFSFNTTGQLNINLYPIFKVRYTNIFIGSTGFHPDSTNFTLSPDDPDVTGVPNYIPGIDNGFFISFDPLTSQWTIYLSSSKNYDARNLVITSDSIINNLVELNFYNNEAPRTDLLLVNQGGIFNEETLFHGINLPSSGRSIVTADFDNDMDLDIYILTTGPVINLPNILYENDGYGNFTAVTDAGGAAGSLLGRGDTVSVADYNQDGFLDLFLTNGKSKPPFEKDGPYQLFRNTGNNNHWIELDLVGVKSNTDGIGATIKLTTSNIIQIREQNGGMHRRTQDHQRIHFGLGTNTLIDQIQIEWPSGISQTIRNVRADQVLRIIEPAKGNTTPQFTSGTGSFYIAENMATGNIVTTLTASDPDDNAALSFSITSGNEDGAFSINNSSGVITISHTLDYETSPNYTLAVMVSDDSGLNATDNVTINISDIAEDGNNSNTAGGGCTISNNNATVVDPAMPLMLLAFTILLIRNIAKNFGCNGAIKQIRHHKAGKTNAKQLSNT